MSQVKFSGSAFFSGGLGGKQTKNRGGSDGYEDGALKQIGYAHVTLDLQGY